MRGEEPWKYLVPRSLDIFGFHFLFPINNTTWSLQSFKVRLPYSQTRLPCSLDSQKCLSLFPIFVCLFYLPFNSRRNYIWKQITVPLMQTISQQSNQGFPCSLKIIDNIPSSLKLNAPISVFPKTPGTGSFMADHILYQYPVAVLFFCSWCCCYVWSLRTH